VSGVDPSTKAQLVRHLLDHAVLRGDFTLKSGKPTTWFIDAKQTACRPEAMLLVADAVLTVCPPEATAIGGLTMGADPIAFVAAGVAATRGRPLRVFSVRKEAKDHGGGGRVEPRDVLSGARAAVAARRHAIGERARDGRRHVVMRLLVVGRHVARLPDGRGGERRGDLQRRESQTRAVGVHERQHLRLEVGALGRP